LRIKMPVHPAGVFYRASEDQDAFRSGGRMAEADE
jgi:hypothetical protein